MSSSYDPMDHPRDAIGRFDEKATSAMSGELGVDTGEELVHSGKHEELAQAEERWAAEPEVGISPFDLHQAIRDGAPWDSESVELRDHWGPRQWEEWADATEEARVEDAAQEAYERGRAEGLAAAGARPAPTSAKEWVQASDAAMASFHRAREVMERSSIGALAATLQDAFPTASHIGLDYSDQGDYWYATGVWGDDREEIADQYAIEDELGGNADLLLSNIYCRTDYAFIETDPDGRNPRLNLAKAAAWAREGLS